MQSLSLALRNRGEEGEPLPDLFQQLAHIGCKFRRGWLHLIAGAPGGGKSALMSFAAFKLDKGDNQRVPTLYFSADNDMMTFGAAAVASAMNIHTNKAEELLTEDDPTVYEVLDEVSDHLWVSFQAAPSPKDIREEIDAFASVYGAWPEMIVVDNLMDVDGSSGGFDDERTTQDGILDFLKRKARETGAAIVVLAHVTGAHTNGSDPIPRDGLMNKVDKRPQLVLTLFQQDTNVLGVSVVKHRRGRSKSDGSFYVEIPWLPELAWMGTGKE